MGYLKVFLFYSSDNYYLALIRHINSTKTWFEFLTTDWIGGPAKQAKSWYGMANSKM
jgi:hypothetical protein